MGMSQTVVWILDQVQSPHREHFEVGDEVQIDPVVHDPEVSRPLPYHVEGWQIRIPKHGATVPVDNDPHIGYHPDEIQRIGITGWNFRQLQSKFVVFDFDSDSNHENGLTADELAEVRDRLMTLSYVAIHKSRSGKGIHVYVTLRNEVESKNRGDHRRVAEAVLATMCADAGDKIAECLDVFGGVAWIFDRDAAPDGFQIVKAATMPLALPDDWSQLATQFGKRHKRKRGDTGHINEFPEARKQVDLDEGHSDVIDWLHLHGWPAIIDSVDNQQLLRTHTAGLKAAHAALGLAGPFDTDSTGADPGKPNCFAFFEREGRLKVIRYGQGCREALTWDQDGKGWTSCWFNRPWTFAAACKSAGGTRNKRKGFDFEVAELAQGALRLMGADVNIPATLYERPLQVTCNGDSVTLEVTAKEGEKHVSLPGWRYNRGKFEKSIGVELAEREVAESTQGIRYLVTPAGDEIGYCYLNAKRRWSNAKKDNIRSLLLSRGLDGATATAILGKCVATSWELVSQPFQDEYPAPEIWNRNAAQCAFVPAPQRVDGGHPHFDLILKHCGKGLDAAVVNDSWCADNDIDDGAAYLLSWAASLFQRPQHPLPYLFFYREGEDGQESGKSAFHRALGLLMKGGYVDAKGALLEKFNGQLVGAVLCYVDEEILTGAAYAKIKSWTDAPQISIRDMCTKAFMIDNCTHWVQTANDREACPIFPGDRRVVMIEVPPLPKAEQIPWMTELKYRLEEEAPAFLATLLNTPLPTSKERLFLPVLETAEKAAALGRTAILQPNRKNFLDTKALADAVYDHVVTVDLSSTESASGSPVKCTASELRDALGDGPWPSNPAQFSRALSGAVGALSERGVCVVLPKDQRDSERNIQLIPEWATATLAGAEGGVTA